jgi:uncharacterized membrane protein
MTLIQASDEDVVRSRQLALIAAFTALVFLSTSLFYIPLVSSTGFFNLGETFVYLAALIGGPIVGAIAGGVGASMADMVLGYGFFAPATLILKGLEGFVAGLIFIKIRDTSQNIRFLLLAIISIFLIGFSTFVTTPALNGVAETTSIEMTFRILDPTLIPQHIFDPTIEDVYQRISFHIPGLLIVIIALLLCLIMWLIEFRMGEKGQMILACLLAGPIIIIGYFLFEALTLSPDPSVAFQLALTEVPFNIAQVIFGTSIAIPIISYLQQLGILQEEKQLS